MNPLDYIDSLIAGIELSSIPIQASELTMLKIFITSALKSERERYATLLDSFEIEGSDSYAQVCATAIRSLK